MACVQPYTKKHAPRTRRQDDARTLECIYPHNGVVAVRRRLEPASTNLIMRIFKEIPDEYTLRMKEKTISQMGATVVGHRRFREIHRLLGTPPTAILAQGLPTIEDTIPARIKEFCLLGNKRWPKVGFLLDTPIIPGEEGYIMSQAYEHGVPLLPECNSPDGRTTAHITLAEPLKSSKQPLSTELITILNSSDVIGNTVFLSGVKIRA